MTLLLDTDVLVDCLRAWPPAERWLSENSSQPFLVPGLVAMELIGDVKPAGIDRTRRLLDRFVVIWPTEEDSILAFELLNRHRLASGLSIPDCYIAAQALNRSARLHSFNEKHFACIPVWIFSRRPFAEALIGLSSKCSPSKSHGFSFREPALEVLKGPKFYLLAAMASASIKRSKEHYVR